MTKITEIKSTGNVIPFKMQTLSEFLNVDLQISSARIKLYEFSEQYPFETTFDAENCAVLFCSELHSMTLRSDLSEDGIDVFQTTIMEYHPTKTIFASEYYEAIEPAMLALKKELKRLNIK